MKTLASLEVSAMIWRLFKNKKSHQSLVMALASASVLQFKGRKESLQESRKKKVRNKAEGQLLKSPRRTAQESSPKHSMRTDMANSTPKTAYAYVFSESLQMLTLLPDFC